MIADGVTILSGDINGLKFNEVLTLPESPANGTVVYHDGTLKQYISGQWINKS